MRIDATGKYIAETAEDMQELLAMASGSRSPVSNTASVLSTPAGLVDRMGLPSDLGYSAGRPDLTSMPDGPSTVMGDVKRRATNTAGGVATDAASLYADLSNQFNDGLGPKAKQAGRSINKGITKVAGRGGRRMAGNAMAALGKVPGMARAGQLLGVAGPALGAVGGGLAVADLVMGQESGANKAMDAAAMGIGGFLGSVGGPLGTAAGVGVGKFLSDGTQFIFGGGKSAEERKMEEALALLRGGAI